MDNGIALSTTQFTGAWRLMCARGRDHSFEGTDGAEYIFSGCPIAFFNVALLTSSNVSSDALRSHAERACAWAATKAVPWLFIVTDEALSPGTDATAALDECGLAALMPLTGMLAQRITPASSSPNGLELSVPQDDHECSALLDVNARAYEMDLETGKDLIGKRSFWVDHFAVLGRTDGTPSSCAAVMMVNGYRYVALVATNPAQQRRGYAEAAMRRALELSAGVHGEVPTFLHATEAGRPIYERMGYAKVARHTVFMEKRFLAGH